MKQTIDELKREAERIAAELGELTSSLPPGSGNQQGSAHRGWPAELRQRFIRLRGALMERGIYDPVLVRFDTASAPQAETAKIAEQLNAWAQG
jgi:hypothetical protein